MHPEKLPPCDSLRIGYTAPKDPAATYAAGNVLRAVWPIHKAREMACRNRQIANRPNMAIPELLPYRVTTPRRSEAPYRRPNFPGHTVTVPGASRSVVPLSAGIGSTLSQRFKYARGEMGLYMAMNYD